MAPWPEHPATPHRLVAAGEPSAPPEWGLPDLIPDLAPDTESLAELLIADRDHDRGR
jgi:hypothetical protein